MWSNLLSPDADLDSGTDIGTEKLQALAQIGTDADTEIRTDCGSDADVNFDTSTAKQIQ